MKNWREISQEERDRLLAVYEVGALTDDMAVSMGVHPETLRRRLREYRHQREAEMYVALESATYMPDSPGKTYDDYITVATDDAVIISDLEIPDHDPALLEAQLLTGIKFNIKNLIIAGDLIATDQQALNHFEAAWLIGNELNMESTIGLTAEILRRFGTWFENIYIISGNHDDRIARKTKGEIWIGMMLKSAQEGDSGVQIHISHYPYMQMQTSRGLVWIAHPENFSINPITLGQELYNNHWPKGHMIIAHCHRRQDGWSPDGQFEIHALGATRDVGKTKYKAMSFNKFRAWDRSFLVIKNGYHYAYDKKSTNWIEVLGGMGKDAEIVGLLEPH